jgi:lipopolysaccharide/colanic/teichoic acid biosynthesis glycosyltransferase/Fe-S-cluster-containing hydrogenase component 2
MPEAICMTDSSPGLHEHGRSSPRAGLTLNDPSLCHRLDIMFDRQFGSVRAPTFRATLNHVLKRLMDVLVSGLGLLLLWPVILAAGVATCLDTGRPIFYSQLRRTRFGRSVRIYKMRTLVVGADRNLNALVNIKNNGKFLNVAKQASSYTRVGRWLERLWIVELPQLWNVFKGEMSLVGNRPIPDYVIGVLGLTPAVAERFASPQGLTGYTQIIGRDAVTDEERIALELTYSEIFEKGDVFLEDLRVMALTVLAYLGIGRRRSAVDFLKTQPSLRLVSGLGSEAIQGDEEIIAPGLASRIDERHLACPTCYTVSRACDSTACHQECVSSCEPEAIRMESGRPHILPNCTACSACVIACPLHAIDKAPLTPKDESYHCSQCGTRYPHEKGVIDLLPRNPNIRHSPYFEFYEKEYVGENPQMHLEDTEWKLRELLPLLKTPGQPRNLFDLGCGGAILGERIAARLNVDRRTASDWSTQILRFALERDPEGIFLRTDAAYLPLRNGAFDQAMLIDVIEHQQQPDQVLRELQRVSRRLLVRTPLEDCWYERQRRRRKELFRESSGHVVHFNADSARERLTRNGWIVRGEQVRHIAWLHWKRVLFGEYAWSGKLTAAARFGLRYVLPTSIYRRLFVTNYNAICESQFLSKENGLVDKHEPLEWCKGGE